MYRIGLFSKITKTTIKTLRYYDEVGLLKPAYIDNENGYRYYTTEQLINLHKIISLRQTGFTIDEIILITKGVNEENILNQRKNEIELQLLEMQDKLSRINHYIKIKENKENDKMSYQAIIKKTPECIVYSKRMVVSSYNDYFKVIPAIGEECKKVNPNLKCSIPEYCFIIYHDGEYKEKDIDIEFCEAVEEFGTETETIKFKKLPSVTVISILHKGAYNELGKAYAYAFKWIEENGYLMSENPRESYIDGIWNKEKEEDWLTEIQIPIIKK